MIKHKIYIITGLSGSGKSTALKAFEDIGLFCVDNLPVSLLPEFFTPPLKSKKLWGKSGLAFVMDLREKHFITLYQQIFCTLKQKNIDITLIFLEASEETLIKRFSQARRPHPLNHSISLLESICEEKKIFKKLRKSADKIIDTSRYHINEFKSLITKFVLCQLRSSTMHIHIMSFGFKYGVPLNVDIIVDVRFLNNPYFIPKLKNIDGETEEVKAFILNQIESFIFLKKYTDLLDYLIPLYKAEKKLYLNFVVGCTGGRHRSVVIASELYKHILKTTNHIQLSHRDKDK